ncbi:MAG: hypothetical protein D6775_15880 [Caldilineae bacterium]|nr:MAG: hypothetical protein D6775_15880 [Caldilineae bacterium]
MWHPLTALPANWFWPFLVLTLVVLALFQVIDRPLKTPAAPVGIVSYELAGSVERARAILESWDSRARVYAGFSLGFDYLFMPLYATTIGMACLWGARTGSGPAWLGGILAWGVWVAALCDGIENYALWRMLVGEPVAPWPAVARVSALAKFGLILLALVYALVMAVLWVVGS